ncbi:hypothetical protein [Nitrobacter winogradskyi]|uniref:hypothetical protein n=1 Tax=Nitrobacter winogradskyi TaxID=913 RepID=UPI00059CC15E|nr:hypothetical protein [Nitrobacter winogradskyi]
MMVLLDVCFEPAPLRPRWRSAGRRRSTPHLLAGRSAAEDGGRETFLFREEWAQPRGRKSTGAIAAQAIEAKPACGQISPSKRPHGALDQAERIKENLAPPSCNREGRRGRRTALIPRHGD